MTESSAFASQLLQSERVALRAVIAPDAGDLAAELLEAGITDPVRLRFALASAGGTAAAMGDGATPGLEATLVCDGNDRDAGSDDLTDGDTAPDGFDAAAETGARTVNLPEAFGMKPMAPVLRRR